MSRTKAGNVAGFFVLALGVCIIGLLYFWSFTPYKILSVQNAPVPIQPPTLASAANTTIIATTKLCKTTDIIPTVTRTIVGSGVVLMTPSYPGVLNSPGCVTLRQAIILPDFLPAGSYHIHWRVAYNVNPIRQVVVQYDSQTFQVTKATTQ